MRVMCGVASLFRIALLLLFVGFLLGLLLGIGVAGSPSADRSVAPVGQSAAGLHPATASGEEVTRWSRTPEQSLSIIRSA
jgi:hypothetical protein